MKGIAADPKTALSQLEIGTRDQKLRKACKDFESVFTYQMLRSMRKTIDKCDLFHGGNGEEIYESLLDQELAKSMAGLGEKSLAETLYQELRNKDVILSPEMDGVPAHIPEQEPNTPALPIEGRVSSHFGWREDPFTGERRFHRGMDLAGDEGAPVRASMAGRVVLSDYQEGYGNVIVLDHGGGLTTVYAHNKENLAREGEWIPAGSTLARLGSTGRSTGPHLHFEVRRHGRHIDPEAFLGIEERGSSSALARAKHLRNPIEKPIDVT